MKRKLLFIIIIHIALFIPLSKAYMQSMQTNTPVPPRSGRGNESSFYSMLSGIDTSYEQWIRDGRVYVNRKEYEQAIYAFRKAVKLHPSSEEARFLLGRAYELRYSDALPGDRTNWQALAIKEYEAAIDLGDHLPARYNLAVIYKNSNSFKKARKQLEYILLVSSCEGLKRLASRQLKDLFNMELRPEHLSVSIKDGLRNE